MIRLFAGAVVINNQISFWLTVSVIHMDNLSIISVNISSVTNIMFVSLEKQSTFPQRDMCLSKHDYDRDIRIEILWKVSYFREDKLFLKSKDFDLFIAVDALIIHNVYILFVKTDQHISILCYILF